MLAVASLRIWSLRNWLHAKTRMRNRGAFAARENLKIAGIPRYACRHVSCMRRKRSKQWSNQTGWKQHLITTHLLMPRTRDPMFRPMVGSRSTTPCSKDMRKEALAHELDSVIRAVRAGDTERFGDIVSVLEAGVRAIFAIMIPDKSLVPDLTHETFVVAYLKLDEYRVGTDFAAWVKTIARNLASNERRRWFREQRFSSRYAVALEDGIVGPWLDELTERLDLEQQTQLLASLQDCLAGLRHAARTTIEHFYLRGLSVADIAASTGRSPGATRGMLFRARAALAQCLVAKGFFAFREDARGDGQT